jgi:hypothetical protein
MRNINETVVKKASIIDSTRHNISNEAKAGINGNITALIFISLSTHWYEIISIQ